jgi:hypothetical protein
VRSALHHISPSCGLVGASPWVSLKPDPASVDAAVINIDDAAIVADWFANVIKVLPVVDEITVVETPP